MTPPGPRSSALSRTQPQSIQGIYWDLSKQRISKLYRFFISNNPSPRIRTFKSQSNLTSDRWPGSISLRIPAVLVSECLPDVILTHPSSWHPPAVRASPRVSGWHWPALWAWCDPVTRWPVTQISGHISHISTPRELLSPDYLGLTAGFLQLSPGVSLDPAAASWISLCVTDISWPSRAWVTLVTHVSDLSRLHISWWCRLRWRSWAEDKVA